MLRYARTSLFANAQELRPTANKILVYKHLAVFCYYDRLVWFSGKARGTLPIKAENVLFITDQFIFIEHQSMLLRTSLNGIAVKLSNVADNARLSADKQHVITRDATVKIFTLEDQLLNIFPPTVKARFMIALL
jgi:hypothetical protein